MTDRLSKTHRAAQLLAQLASLLAPLLALIVLWTCFGLAVALMTKPGSDPWTFFSFFNQAVMLQQAVPILVAACGMTVVIIAGGIDLAAGSVIALAAVAGASALVGVGGPVWLAIAAAAAAAMATGTAAGAVSGTLITALRLPPFIVTLGMLSIARGLAKISAHEQAVVATYGTPAYAAFEILATWMKPSQFVAARDPWWHVPLVVAPGVWIATALIAVTWVLLTRTVFGRHLYALGSNEAAARLCGVPVHRTKILAYAWCGLCVGLAGLLDAAKLVQGDPTTASGRELDIIAAVVMGGASLSGGVGSIGGAAIGALITVVLRNGITQLGGSAGAQEITIGVAIIAAVAIDQFRRRRG